MSRNSSNSIPPLSSTSTSCSETSPILGSNSTPASTKCAFPLNFSITEASSFLVVVQVAITISPSSEGENSTSSAPPSSALSITPSSISSFIPPGRRATTVATSLNMKACLFVGSSSPNFLNAALIVAEVRFLLSVKPITTTQTVEFPVLTVPSYRTTSAFCTSLPLNPLSTAELIESLGTLDCLALLTAVCKRRLSMSPPAALAAWVISRQTLVIIADLCLSFAPFFRFIFDHLL
mmetsp:Transcript_2827/g.5823  ORF Transcript_2827/g.5823 Transcript_2827/m.5823 type:complete len:236 (-) Transcript_2827:58-765(-)